MKFLRSFRILIFIAVFLGMIGIGNPPSTRADDPLTFSGQLSVFWSHFEIRLEDSDWYTVYVQAGETVELTFSYTHGLTPYGGGDLRVFIGTQIDTIPIALLWPPDPSYPIPPVVSGTKTYTRVMTTTESIQIGLILSAPLSSIVLVGIGLTYELTISGATLTPPPPPPVAPIDPIIATEEAAGLQRVQDNALPVVIYTPTAANPDRFIDIRDLEGKLLLYISADDLAALPEFPAENLLIASTANGFISVYKLTTGEYQVNVGPLPDGKVHVIIFDGIPRTHTYGYTWEITELVLAGVHYVEISLVPTHRRNYHGHTPQSKHQGRIGGELYL